MNPMMEGLRFAFRASPLHAVVVEEVLPADVCAVLRERVRGGLLPYWMPERGRYHVNETHEEDEVARTLAEAASAIVQETLAPERVRWQRLVHGDYALYKDDRRRWSGRDEAYELVLDFSAAASDDAQVIYAGETTSFVVPQQPGLMALVARGPSLRRFDRYLTHRVGGAEVFRLNLPLRKVTA